MMNDLYNVGLFWLTAAQLFFSPSSGQSFGFYVENPAESGYTALCYLSYNGSTTNWPWLEVYQYVDLIYSCQRHCVNSRIYVYTHCIDLILNMFHVVPHLYHFGAMLNLVWILIVPFDNMFLYAQIKYKPCKQL